MFHVSDFWNLREFIAKLNNKLSNLFDGKYSSLREVPAEFPPKGHIHSVASESEPGFMSAEDYKNFSNFYNTAPGLINGEGFFWKGDQDKTPINVNGYAMLYCNKLGYHMQKWSSLALRDFEGPYIHLFHQNVIYFDCEFTVASGDNTHIVNTEDFVLNLYIELTDIERYVMRVGKQIERYLASFHTLPYIDIPLALVFPYLGEWAGNVKFGSLRINDYRGDRVEDYVNLTAFSNTGDFGNYSSDIITSDENLKNDILNENFSSRFLSYYFAGGDSLEIYSSTMYRSLFNNQDFFQHYLGTTTQNKILIQRELTGDTVYFRTVYINGFLRLFPDNSTFGCIFYSL